MSHKKAFLFGYSQRSIFLTKELQKKGFSLSIIVSDKESYDKAKEDGYDDVMQLDMTNDEALERLNIDKKDHLVCVMRDSHFNVFLTLSLHALFPKNRIIALSDSSHTTQKLKMAGATKVIDLYQVSANRIYNILHKPVATQMIEQLFSPTTTFSLREITIPQNSSLDNKMVDDIDFSNQGVILIGMIDKKLSQQFIFITSGLEHQLNYGDVLVCIGYDEDLDRFERYIRVA
ncbi:MAG TPA: TrkA family potassium uptake protein [Nitratifractor sp.]|nr:TrkA family potassium uptake protein [Nitratifractor sp.]